MKEKEGTYTGWITSPNIFKRAFAIWGHYMIANIIISLGIMVVAFLGIIAFNGLVN